MASAQQVAQQLPQSNATNGSNTKPGNLSPHGSPSGPIQHRRVYQACIPCRKRKVKCDLGSVDNPQPPPCVRCRRESKECYFSVTRRKQKLDENDEPIYDPDFVDRNARKRTISDRGSEVPEFIERPQLIGRASIGGSYRDTPLAPVTPGGGTGQYNPLSRPGQEQQPPRREPNDYHRVMTNPEAQSTMRAEIYGPHDALNLLYKAATDDSEARQAEQNKRQKVDNGSVFAHSREPSRHNSIQTPATGYRDDHAPQRPGLVPTPNSYPADPASRQNDPGYKTALQAWSRFRFVRAGWFTPEEAILYIDYYYKYLSPLTPISPPTFRDPSSHVTLLHEEPILVVTLLTISSRYLQLPGTGGKCRSFAIHEQLWTYLRGMIERCLWGQESFGGGFCGSGATNWEQTSSTAPWRGLRKGSLRTLGTVESLMILTEWHPRGLHFPPQDATDELMLPMNAYGGLDGNGSTVDDNGEPSLSNGVRGKRIESWLEPAWRSDRMCWMLLSTAHGLSYELGVFDQIEDSDETDRARPEYDEEAYRLRAERIKKLLLIYITQLSGRLGWTNMVTMTDAASRSALSFRKPRKDTDGNTPGTNTSIINSFSYIPDLELDDQIIHCWASITTAMRAGNDKIFRSRKYTTDIIANGNYLDLLAEFQPILAKWKESFDSYNLPQYIRYILTIEYEYVRIYINSLSLQAVVERSTNHAAAGVGRDKASPNFLNKIPMTLYGGFTPQDSHYVSQVISGSRNLLRTVVEGLLPLGYLKHAPVRTYFRIISGAMFLLKTFALGASKSDVEVSIGLMDRAVEGLRGCVVDDVHLGSRFADLLESLTGRLRTRFMHAPLQSEGGNQGDEQVAGNNNEGGEEGNGVGRQGDKQSWGIQDLGFGDGHDINISATAFDLGPNVFFGPTYHNPVGNSTAGPPVGPGAGGGSSNVNTPGQSANMFENNIFGGAGDWGNGVGASDMWYLPPGAAFFQNADQGTTQTAEGVNLGGIDLLDYMAMDAFSIGDEFRG